MSRVGAIYTMPGAGPDGNVIRTTIPTTGTQMYACSAAAIDQYGRVSHCAYVLYGTADADATATAVAHCQALFPLAAGWHDHSVSMTMVLVGQV